MINQNLFGSAMAPSWHQIDRIHIGSRATLGNDGELDSMLVGRYVLVKYVENKAYDQNYKQQILSMNESDLTEEEKIWKECYGFDAPGVNIYNSSLDADGIIYQKQRLDNGSIGYMPIANLNTTQYTNGYKAYIQPHIPKDASTGSLWVQTDEWDAGEVVIYTSATAPEDNIANNGAIWIQLFETDK